MHGFTAALVAGAIIAATASGQDGAKPQAEKPKAKKTPAKKGPPPPSPTMANVKYGDHPRQAFDFWKPESDSPTPVLVFIHGGGWMNGDKSGVSGAQVKRFLEKKVAVAAINYRFIPQAMEQKVEPPVKAPLYDAARALQLIRSKATEWNIDPNRIGATGGSAGACTSLWLAMHDDLADPKSADPVARQSTRLQFVAVDGAQTSLDPKQLREWMPNAMYAGHAFGFHAPGRKRPEEFELCLKDREKVLPWIKEYSPIEHASKDDPPIYLYYPSQKKPPVMGENQDDPTHSAVMGLALQEKLARLGVEVHLNCPTMPSKAAKNSYDFLFDRLTGK